MRKSCAMSEKYLWQRQDTNGSIEFLQNAPCNGAMQFFVILVYLRKRNSFKGFNDFISMKYPTLDESFLEIDFDRVKNHNPREFVRYNKVMITHY